MIAEAKHFVAYDQETDSVMCSYNRINGACSCQDPATLSILNGWGFAGFVEPDAELGRRFRAALQVRNTGARAGSEVVELYVDDPPAAGEPPHQLKGFAKVALRPGRHGR